MSIAETWDAVADEPTDEDEFRTFVAQKLGDLQAQFAKLTATLNLGNRWLLYVVVVWLVLLSVLFALHAAATAGWLGR